MFSLRTVPLGAVGLLWVAGLSASGPGSEAKAVSVLTAPVRDAIHAVWQSSPEVEVARAELAAAVARSRASAQPLHNPELSLEAENADVDRRVLGVSLALDLSGKRRAQSEHGEAQQRAVEAAFDGVRNDVALRWLKAWATAALARRQSELGRHRVELMQRFDNLSAQRLEVGDISRPERDLAGLALAEAQMQQATLQGDQAGARADLVAIGGDVLTELPALPDGAPPPSADLISRPVEDLLELRQARAQLERADTAIDIARRARWADPVVRLSGGQVQSGPVTDRVIGLDLSIPLPVFNSGNAEVDAARADADVAAASMIARQRTLRAAQMESHARYDALRTAVVSFQSGHAADFEARTALLEKLWQAGEIATSDYLMQLKQSLDTALAAVELETRTWQAWFNYLAAAGRLLEQIDDQRQERAR